jgi:hypothetical protein
LILTSGVLPTVSLILENNGMVRIIYWFRS